MTNLQTIQADSLPAALAEARRRFGREAVILHTRSVEERAWFGLRKRQIVELTVAKSKSCLPGMGATASFSQAVRARKPSPPIAEGVAPIMPSVKDDVAISTMRDLRAEIDALTARVDRIVSPTANNAPRSSADHGSVVRPSAFALASVSEDSSVDWTLSESKRVAQC